MSRLPDVPTLLQTRSLNDGGGGAERRDPHAVMPREGVSSQVSLGCAGRGIRA